MLRSRTRPAPGLFVGLARFPKMHVQIDEAGSNDEAASVELLVGAPTDLVRRRDFGNAAVFQQDIHGRVDPSRGVNEVAAFDYERTRVRFIRHCLVSLPSLGMCRIFHP